ncbi:MAG TPA: cytochrome b/b6 domain-containing protein [Polyangiaceae bacterium]
MPQFRTYQPKSLRLWHWLDATVILALLATVLLRKTFLSWRTNAALIESRLQQTGVDITPELAKEIAVAIRDPLWEWHIRLGVILGALLIGRMAIALLIEKRIPGVAALKVALRLKTLPAQERGEALHYSLVKSGYAVFYLATMLMVATGLTMVFSAELGISKGLVGSVKEIHELTMWFFVVFAGGHLLGIIVAENGKDPGIISDMVNGGDPKMKP